MDPALHAIAIASVMGVILVGSLGCSVPAPSVTDQQPFAEAVNSGLDFLHHNGMSGEFLLPEIMGAGVGLIDHDGDGDLDLFLVQGPDGPDRLYRNDLEDGVLRFVDVTRAAGLTAAGADGAGMGVAVGDYDNDGHDDLYVTRFGSNTLWRNNGDGTFEDRTAYAGVDDRRWSVPATFVDLDRDGWLDLYVGNYVDLTPATNKACFNKVRDYCSPLSYNPVPDRLFRNLGDGRFEDVTATSGLASAYGNGLGVVSGDFNGDGWIDLYVANDGTPNQCWLNRGDGRVHDVALAAGCALNDQGDAEAGMGVTAADYDGDGDEDLFLTHLRNETHTIYVNDGQGGFVDETIRSGLGPVSRPRTGFGTCWLDHDNDGWLDLFAVNGAVTVIDALVQQGDPYPYHEPNQLFRNVSGESGARRFVEFGPVDAGPLARSEISRGAACGDLDLDGDVDLVITQVNGPARVLLNRTGNRHSWLGVRLVDTGGVRDARGARIAVAGNWRRVRTDGSYASSSAAAVLFGLGQRQEATAVEVIWPDGQVERWDDQPLRQWVVLRRGEGEGRKQDATR